MAMTTTWSVINMRRDIATGGVLSVHWECVVRAPTGENAIEQGMTDFEPDADAADFIAYDDLTEEIVLGWVYDSLATDEETGADAKARIEADREAKVNERIARNNAQATGVPWGATTEA